MNWYFMCFLVLVLSHCIDVGGRLLGVLEAVCKLSVLTISKIPQNSGFWVGWQFSCYRLIRFRLTHIQLLSLFQSQCIDPFNISSAPMVGQSSSAKFPLPYSLLLDYSTLRSLPYPTLLEVEKPLLVGACLECLDGSDGLRTVRTFSNCQVNFKIIQIVLICRERELCALLYVAREDYALFRSARTFWITFVSPSVRPQEKSGSAVSSINHHRTTANLSNIIWCMSGGVWWCLDYVWWCLVVSDACLVVSGGVNVYKLIYMGRYPFQCM